MSGRLSCARRVAGWAAGCFASARLMLAAGGAFAQQVPVPLPPAAVQIIQTPGASQITPPTFRPPLEKGPSAGPAVPAPPPVEAPAGAEKLFVQLGGLVVEGGFRELAAETRALEARLVSGKQVSGADLFAAANELEGAYARAGFVLARVVLPPQKLGDGSILRLVVIDGFIERLETKNLPERVRDRVTAIAAPLIGQRHLKLADIERRLLLAGDIPGVVLRSTLAAGSVTGAAVLALEANYQPINGLLTLDNSLPTSLGTWTPGIGLDVSSVFGLGELFYFRVLGNPGSGDTGFFTANPINRTLAGGVVVPLGSDGVTLNVEGTQARTAPISTVAGLQATDLFERLSTRLRYAWLRSRQSNVSIEAAFDLQSDSQQVIFDGTNVPLSQDRLRILRANTDGDTLTSWGGFFSGHFSASFGLNGLGARTAAEALASGVPLSRQGADANFAKVDGSINYSQPMYKEIFLGLNARAQYSFGQALLRSEQIGIAAPAGLSTFDAGTLQGDSGYAVRAELLRSFDLPTILDNVGFVATPYVFGALGSVYLLDPTALENWSTTAAAYGIGLRINDGVRGTRSFGSLSLEFGNQQRSNGTPTNTRFTIFLSQRF